MVRSSALSTCGSPAAGACGQLRIFSAIVACRAEMSARKRTEKGNVSSDSGEMTTLRYSSRPCMTPPEGSWHANSSNSANKNLNMELLTKFKRGY